MKSLRVKISLIVLVIMILSFVSIALISIKSAKNSLEDEMTKALVQSVHAAADTIKAKTANLRKSELPFLFRKLSVYITPSR